MHIARGGELEVGGGIFQDFMPYTSDQFKDSRLFKLYMYKIKN